MTDRHDELPPDRLPLDGHAANDLERRLDDWLAGDLGAGSEQERALLAAEPALLPELERHRALRRQLRELPADAEPPARLWEAIAQRTVAVSEAAAPPGPRVALWRRTVAVPAWVGLAALLAIALGAALLLRRHSPAGPAPVVAAAAATPGAPLPGAAATAGPQASPQEVAELPGAGGAATAADTAPSPPATAPPPERQRAADGRRAPAAPASGSPRDRLAAATVDPAPLPDGTGQASTATAPPPQPSPSTLRPLPPAARPLGEIVPVLAAYAETDRELTALGADLRRSIEARQDRLPPETRALVFANLETIERALAEIETALAAAPGDGDLARTYIAYRQREIAVLRRANAMAARL